MSMPFALVAQEGVIAYCQELKQVAQLAAKKERFSSISGKPREGSFRESNLALSGWMNCAVYGSRTYTCDSESVASAEQASAKQQKLADEIRVCLAGSWHDAKDRSSAEFIVMQHAQEPVSLTLSIDQMEHSGFLVRLILFARSN
jgi:hypothetical protein